MITVTQAMLERRSARAYLSKPVPVDTIRDIITIARRTASSSNMQPWRLSVMAGADLDRLRGAVRQSLAANPSAEGSEYRIYAANLKDPTTADGSNAPRISMARSALRARTRWRG